MDDELEMIKGALQMLREAIGLKDGQGIEEAMHIASMRKKLLKENQELQKRLDRILILSLIKQSEEATAFDALAEIAAVARGNK